MNETKIKVPRGIRNNNPLNIRKGNNWKGERPNQTDKAFEEFESMTMGIRAALILMRNHIDGHRHTRPRLNTIRKLVSVWAPPSENATEEYIQYVARHVGMSPDEIINPRDRKQLTSIAREMAYVECGLYLDPKLFDNAYDLIV